MDDNKKITISRDDLFLAGDPRAMQQVREISCEEARALVRQKNPTRAAALAVSVHFSKCDNNHS